MSRPIVFKRNLLLLLIGVAVMSFYWWKEYKPHTPSRQKSTITPATIRVTEEEIYQKTRAEVVINFIKENYKLPGFYITKSQARAQGWQAEKGNLCEVLPGKAIGGDRFGNREKKLPNQPNRTYYEADVNYRCGTRNADRVVYSNDGLVFLTTDHYKTFEAQ